MLDKTAFINYNSNVAKINAAMAQVVEHILGKDEVTSSNLVSSSKNKGTTSVVLLFFVRKL